MMPSRSWSSYKIEKDPKLEERNYSRGYQPVYFVKGTFASLLPFRATWKNIHGRNLVQTSVKAFISSCSSVYHYRCFPNRQMRFAWLETFTQGPITFKKIWWLEWQRISYGLISAPSTAHYGSEFLAMPSMNRIRWQRSTGALTDTSGKSASFAVF